MIDRLHCQTVREFFDHFNWHSKTTRSIEPSWEDVNELQCGTVDEFFSRVNWQGRSLSLASRHSADRSFSLTLPLQEFFDLFGWENQPEVGFIAQFKTPSPNTAPDLEVSLKDLSNLF
jgi:hypothetical protein